MNTLKEGVYKVMPGAYCDVCLWIVIEILRFASNLNEAERILIELLLVFQIDHQPFLPVPLLCLFIEFL